jgi:hypothetical protein
MRIFVYGAVIYFEVFGTERCTNFQFSYGGAELIRINEMAVCPTGNDVT